MAGKSCGTVLSLTLMYGTLYILLACCLPLEWKRLITSFSNNKQLIQTIVFSNGRVMKCLVTSDTEWRCWFIRQTCRFISFFFVSLQFLSTLFAPLNFIMEKVESILPSSLWHQLTRIWPPTRPDQNQTQDQELTSIQTETAELKSRTLHWTGLTHLCAKITEFKPNWEQTRTTGGGMKQKGKTMDPELVLTLFDMFAFFGFSII